MIPPRATRKLSRRRRRIRYASRRLAWILLAAVVVAGMVLADRAGLFGRAPRGDLDIYDGRSFRVVRVVDGDTLDVDCPDGEYSTTRVRLWGVDTPETKKPNAPVGHFGPEATAFTRQASLGKTVTLRLDHRRTRDKYHRLLAYVVLPDARTLNGLLVNEGYGYADPRYEHRFYDEFARHQRRARKARRGLWKDVPRKDLPYYYRDSLKLPDDIP